MRADTGERRKSGIPKHQFLILSYSSKFQCAIFYDIVETSQVAKKLREIMRPNPAKARPKKKGCVSVADAGDEVEFISEKVVAGIGCYASSAEGTLDYGRP